MLTTHMDSVKHSDTLVISNNQFRETAQCERNSVKGKILLRKSRTTVERNMVLSNNQIIKPKMVLSDNQMKKKQNGFIK